MLEFPTWKKLWYWALTLVIAAAAVPSLVSVTGAAWPSFLPNPKVALGLDLAGGSQLLLEANPDQVARQRLENMEEDVRSRLKAATTPIAIGDISARNGTLSFMLKNPGQVDAAREAILPLTTGAGLTGQRDWNIQVQDSSRFVLTQTKAGLDEAVSNAMDSAITVVRKRIDALGTREPTIIRQGANRIVVQVPGLKDPTALKALLGQTAKLEFKMVDENAAPSDVAQGIAPPGDEIVPYAAAAPGPDGKVASIAVQRLGGIKGDQLTNAKQEFDQQGGNQAVVSITFNQQGGEKFAALTSANVGKRFAIILDGKVLSAPSINTPILGGSAIIQGQFTVQSATQLAVALRSGALPVDLTVVEERTVRAELGNDSIHRGLVAMGIGSLLVVLLMIASYGRFGIYATCALILNLLMILGVMAMMGTTLTLPGIAGFVLTIGAAVDANVLIYERMREERKKGRRVVAAVETGYKEASRAIYDANVTNAIAGILLFAFGSGPVRGFAVVLIIGLFTSVFTGVTMTRMWVADWLRKARPTELNV